MEAVIAVLHNLSEWYESVNPVSSSFLFFFRCKNCFLGMYVQDKSAFHSRCVILRSVDADGRRRVRVLRQHAAPPPQLVRSIIAWCRYEWCVLMVSMNDQCRCNFGIVVWPLLVLLFQCLLFLSNFRFPPYRSHWRSFVFVSVTS